MSGVFQRRESGDNVGFPYDDETDDGEEHATLRTIAIDELASTHLTIERFPKLKARGIPTKYGPSIGEPLIQREDEETSAQYMERVGVEAAKRGVSTNELLYPIVSSETRYWELDGTKFVYAEDFQIAKFDDTGTLIGVSLDLVSKRDLEEIIQGLRLLCTPFYGAQ